MKRKIGFVLAFLAMTIGMVACGSANNQPAPAAKVGTMTVNSFDIEITYVPFAKYQVDILKDIDYYVDALEEDDSPAFVFIGPEGKSFYRDIVDIQADDSQNVTITVRSTSAKILGSSRNPITQVEIYPFPASITVVDEQGKELNCNH